MIMTFLSSRLEKMTNETSMSFGVFVLGKLESSVWSDIGIAI